MLARVSLHVMAVKRHVPSTATHHQRGSAVYCMPVVCATRLMHVCDHSQPDMYGRSQVTHTIGGYLNDGLHTLRAPRWTKQLDGLGSLQEQR